MAFKDEFISRDTQLPAQGRVGAADMRQASQSRDAQQIAPLGTPPADYTVRSVYDARPISGTDFNIVLLTPVEIDPTGSYSFTVPQGFVGVLRKIRVLSTLLEPPINTLTEQLLTIQANGADVQNNKDIPIGEGLDWPIECFVLADELQTLGVRIESTSLLTDQLAIYCYGNFLLKTGRPYSFEIGNYAGRANITQPGMAMASVPEAATQVHGLTGLGNSRPYKTRPRRG